MLHTTERFHAERHSRGCCGLFPRRADSGGAEQPGQTITPQAGTQGGTQGGPTQGDPTQGDPTQGDPTQGDPTQGDPTQGDRDRLVLAADIARKIDPDLAEIYWRLMTIRGHHHKQALSAVANRLADRIFSVMRRGKPYVLCDRDGREITTAEAKALVTEQCIVPVAIRASGRANRTAIAA